MSRRSKGLLITLAFVSVALAVLYTAAPAILAAVAEHALSGVVKVRKLEIGSVGLTRIDVSVMDVDNSQMHFDAQDATIRFKPWPFTVRGVDINRARLTLASTASNQAGSVALPASFPVPPPFPLRIDRLAIRASTPWGPVDVPVSIKSSPGSAGGLEAEVHGPDFLASVGNPAKNRQTLRIQDGSGTPLLLVGASVNGHYPADFEGRFDPRAAAEWIRQSPLIPSGVKASFAPFRVGGDEVRFRGTLDRNLDFSAKLQGSVAVSDQRAVSERLFDKVELRDLSNYTVTHSGPSWSGSGKAGLSLDLNAGTTLTGHDPTWHWDGGGIAAGLTAPRLEQLGLGADAVNVTTTSLSASAGQGRIHVGGFQTSAWPRDLPHYDVDGSWSFGGGAFKAGGTGKAPSLPDVGWTLQSAGGQGSVDVSVHDPATALLAALKKYSGIGGDLKIKSGEVDGRYHFQWTSTGEKTSLAATAEPVDADFDKMQVRGLKIQVANQGNSIDRLVASVSAPTMTLGAGVTAEQVELKLRLAYPVVHLDKAQLHLLGGKISLRPSSIDLDKDKSVLVADVDGVSLGKIISLFGLKSTQLSGKVSGPVRVVYSKQGGLEINQGDLHNIEPGVLKFSMSEDSEAASKFSNVALQALRDFQYKELKASLVYKPDGEYRITARIVGSNPNVLGGHPIALNPTITGRLPAVFRAFFITGDFDRAIIETLQKEESASTPGKTPTLKGQ
ncbi:MAG: YdbH domain-containing protein [Arenicellales bacterium]